MDEDIFKCIIDSINEAEKYDIEGFKKKHLALEAIKNFIDDDEIYERYEPLISLTIDGLIGLDKKDYNLIINKFKKLKLFCC